MKADGQPVLVRYGISDDDAFAVGLTCGGILDVFVEPLSQQTFGEFNRVREDIDASRPVGVATVIAHPDPHWLGRHLVVWPDGISGDLGSERANHAIGEDAQGLLAAGRNSTITYGPDGQRRGEGMQIFFASYAPTELFTLRTALVRSIEDQLADGLHNLFTRKGLGHLAGHVYALLRGQVSLTIDFAARRNPNPNRQGRRRFTSDDLPPPQPLAPTTVPIAVGHKLLWSIDLDFKIPYGVC